MAVKSHHAVLGILGLAAFAAVLPAWVWFIHSHPSTDSLTLEMAFLADASLPLVALLFASSWLGGS
jgi:hypothetical protein